MFNLYPYSNFHEINLDWLIKQLKAVVSEMENFVELNQIKVADPVTWSLTSAYERLTIVSHEDSNGLKAYLSIRDVPAGTALSNANYWAELGTLIDNTVIEEFRQELITMEQDIQQDFQDLEQNLKDMLPVNVHDKVVFYIDGVNGSDNNDGLTQLTAFKTFDRFMEMGNKYTSLHGRIISAGTYTFQYNECANIDLDLQALVSGVDIVLNVSSDENRFVFYNCRLNIFGAADAAIPTTLRLANTSALLYMAACASSIHDIVIPHMVRCYGGECWLENVELKTLYTRNAFARVYAVHFTNQITTETALNLLNSVCIVIGGCTVDALTNAGVEGHAIVRTVGGYVSLGSQEFNLSVNSNYYNGLIITEGTLIAPSAKITNLESYSNNGNLFSYADIPTLIST